jgi:hypothetical protein
MFLNILAPRAVLCHLHRMKKKQTMCELLVPAVGGDAQDQLVPAGAVADVELDGRVLQYYTFSEHSS